MSAQVHLFGRLQVVVGEGSPAQFPTRPTESLFAFLATRGGRPISRQALASAVWPDVDLKKATNRLRTGLVHIRQALQPWQSLVTDRESVTLATADCEMDLLSAERLYRRSRIAQETDEERDTLAKLLGVVGIDLLEDWPEPWTDGPRSLWRERRIEAALRLANLGLASNDYELAESEALRALMADEFNEEAWATYLRVMAETERHSLGVDRFRGARQKRLNELSFDFSTELLQLAKRVSTGQLRPSPLIARSTEAAREVMARALDRELAANPESMLPFLASEGFRKEAMLNPLEAWKILRGVIDRTEGSDESRMQAMIFAARMADMVDEYGAAFDYAEWIIENLPEDRREHLTAVNLLGFLSFELREWDDAWRHLNRYLELARKYGTAVDVAIASGQIAALYWHQGDLDKAVAEYSHQLQAIGQDQTHNGLHNMAALLGNLGMISTVQGNWEGAKQRLGQAHSLAVANGFDFMRGSVMGPLGLALIMTGQPAEGKRLTSLGLGHTFRSRYRRTHQISADYAAGALVVLGLKQEGLSVLNAYTGFRDKAHHARSAAEERFADWIADLAGSAKPVSAGILEGTRSAEVVARACDLLESA